MRTKLATENRQGAEKWVVGRTLTLQGTGQRGPEKKGRKVAPRGSSRSA